MLGRSSESAPQPLVVEGRLIIQVFLLKCRAALCAVILCLLPGKLGALRKPANIQNPPKKGSVFIVEGKSLNKHLLCNSQVMGGFISASDLGEGLEQAFLLSMNSENRLLLRPTEQGPAAMHIEAHCLICHPVMFISLRIFPLGYY